MTEDQTDNRSQITAAHFNATEWLARWTEAGGGYVAGTATAHLLRPTGDCAALDSLSQEIADHDRREAVSALLRAITDKAD
jgi:hypothetical protein